MIKCAIYARYSSDLQNDRSIDDQVRNCQRFAEKQYWAVLKEHVYADRAVSGRTTAGRSGLAALLKAAEMKKKPFDCLLVDDTSRLSRNKLEQGQLIQDLQELGIFVYFVSDSIDTRDEVTQDVLLPVYGIKDSLYCRELAKKTKRGMTGQVLSGYNAGGRTYGYHYERVPDPSGMIDKKTHQVRSLGTRIKPDPQQTAVVCRIFEMFAEGRGLKTIATALTYEGIEPPRAIQQSRNGTHRPSWCPNAIRNILKNPKYIGDWTWNKTASMRRSKTGRRTYSPRTQDEWVVRKDPALAIIDPSAWEKAQQRFRKQSDLYCRGDRASRRKYLLSGLLKCSICGANLIVSQIRTNGEILYRCNQNWQRGTRACTNNTAISGTEAERRVTAALRACLSSTDLRDIVLAETNRLLKQEGTRGAGDWTEAVAKRQKVSKDIDRLISLVTDSDIELPSVREAIQMKEQELAEINRLFALKQTPMPRRPTKLELADLDSWFDKLGSLMKEDVGAARHHLSEIIGPLSGKPHAENGQQGLLFTGKPLVEGVLGLIGAASNSAKSGPPPLNRSQISNDLHSIAITNLHTLQ